MEKICKEWRISEEEYLELNDKFGKLAEWQAWRLYQRNSRSSHTDDQTDIAQNIRMALIRAGSYYKRQTYVERCLYLCDEFVKNEFAREVLDSLKKLWENRTRHGANKQKFGPPQEQILEKFVKKYVPADLRPDRSAKLLMDKHFFNYCKSITWNEQKAMGKKITREKPIRANQVSLSEFDFLGSY